MRSEAPPKRLAYLNTAQTPPRIRSCANHTTPNARALALLIESGGDILPLPILPVLGGWLAGLRGGQPLNEFQVACISRFRADVARARGASGSCHR